MYLNLNRLGIIITALAALSSCRLLKHNQIKNKQQHGYWVTFTDKGKKNGLTKGRFKKGTQVGKWTYYNFNGAKERIEVYRGKKITITHFHQNGKIALKGHAKIVNDNLKLHFYYYGPWFFYNEKGTLTKISYYEHGQLQKEDYKIASTTNVYDSLAAELLKLDRDFTKYRDTLNLTHNKYGAKSEEYKIVWRLNKENDSLVYLKIENITNRFGYPEKKLVGENNGIIFYIISFAPADTKEKFLDVFKSAAKKGEITLPDYACFEDKYSVAKFGWQVYGTQYKTNKDYSKTYYPVKKLSALNDRRKSMNLEPENLLLYKEVME